MFAPPAFNAHARAAIVADLSAAPAACIVPLFVTHDSPRIRGPHAGAPERLEPLFRR